MLDLEGWRGGRGGRERGRGREGGREREGEQGRNEGVSERLVTSNNVSEKHLCSHNIPGENEGGVRGRRVRSILNGRYH